jgi:tRNA (cytosine38-C5)-methyltransferase
LVPSDRRSCCFTKAYTHFVEGTGSVLQTNRERRYQDAFQRLVDCKAKNKKPRLEDGMRRTYAWSSANRRH